MTCCFSWFQPAPDGTWLDDGSGSVKPSGNSWQVHQKRHGDAPVNARFSKTCFSGSYFEIKVVEANQSPFIGISTAAGFGQGYRKKGLFYGGPGNLSDGSGCVQSGFGDEVKKGDTIGVFYECCTILSPVRDDTASVTFYHNGRCLGPAFVSKFKKPGSLVYPIVCAGAEGDKFTYSCGKPPSQRLRQPKKGATVYDGTWALKKVCVGPELGQYPLAEKTQGHLIIMNVETAGSGKFNVSVKVVNNKQFTVVSTSNAKYKPFDEFKLEGIGPSTLMMGPPGLMDIEVELGNWMAGVTKWKTEKDTLMLQGATVELSFSRHNEVHHAVETISLP